MKNLLLFCLLVVFSGCGSTDKPSSLPRQELERIEKLFDYFGRMGNLGHVLFFNNKPMCHIGIPLSCSSSCIPSFISDNPAQFQKEIAKCWSTWKKHEHCFLHPNFLFIEDPIEWEGGTYLNLYIINKLSLKQFLKNHKQEIREMLCEFPPVNSIEEFPNDIFLDLIHRNKAFLGVLLGYGFHSSSAFAKLDTSKLTPVSAKPNLKKKYGIATVSFMTDNPKLPEIEELLSTYRKEMEYICDLYERSEFSTCALKTLTMEQLP